ncbi:uncharacterized protein HaLaN_20736 [Haematococcus lacustris]|uniref:Uncharacterized protein n=1 Tax=Haematococcus lacustris TaxID=44745 RepID=A0A699ZWW0_HAELA|nr:uncharacterized protein HaLaN_20736 [Haematococcus lacustris]
MAHGGALSLQRHYGLIVVCVLQAKHVRRNSIASLAVHVQACSSCRSCVARAADGMPCFFRLPCFCPAIKQESPRDLDAAQCEAQNDLPVSKTQSPTLAVSLSPVASDRTSGASSKEPGASTSVGALLGWVAPHHLDLQPPSDMSDRAWEEASFTSARSASSFISARSNHSKLDFLEPTFAHPHHHHGRGASPTVSPNAAPANATHASQHSVHASPAGGHSASPRLAVGVCGAPHSISPAQAVGGADREKSGNQAAAPAGPGSLCSDLEAGSPSPLQQALYQYRHASNPCRTCKPLMEYCQQHSLQPDCDPEPHLGGITSQQDRQDLARLLTAAACLNHAVERMHDDAGWTLVTPGPMRLMYQHHPGCTVHSFRARCELQAPLEHPLCLSREFDLSKTWNKYAVDSLFLKEWSMAEMLCLAVIVVGIDLLEEHGCFLTSLHTPSVLPDNVTIPAHLASNPSVDVRQGSFVAMEPLQPAQPGGSPRTRGREGGWAKPSAYKCVGAH